MSSKTLVGAWLLNFGPPGVPAVFFANAVFNKDGTLVWETTPDIEQPTPVFPFGAYGTISTGVWRKACRKECHKKDKAYDFVSVKEVDVKDLIPSAEHLGIPTARVKFIVMLNLSEDGRTLTGTAEAISYPVADLELSTPLPGLPVLLFVIEGRRITF